MKSEAIMIIESLHGIFKDNKLRLSVAESCTGGLISHYITTLPGASVFFEAGAVTYSAASKERILGVKPQTISSFGAVSRETAMEMADNVRSIMHADYAVSTTGNLGPDVLEGKEKGLVYAAVSSDAGTVVRELKLSGEREEIKEAAAVAALEFLVETAGKRP